MIRLKSRKTKSPGRHSYSIPKRLSILTLTILLLAIPAVIYFTRYISNQTAYFTSTNFRNLAAISDQIQGRILTKGKLFTGKVESLQRSSDFLTSLDELLQGTGLEAITYTTALPNLTGSDTQLAAVMRVEPVAQDSEIVFISNADSKLAAKMRLSSVVEPLIDKPKAESVRGIEHGEGFDVLLVARLEDIRGTANLQGVEKYPQSKVIFQSYSPDVNIDSLDNLTRFDAPDKTIDLKTLRDNTALADVKIGDAEYKLYAQPISLPIRTLTPSEPAQLMNESRWVVCGLVQASHFRRQTWAFPYTVLITFGFITILIALSWPFLKLAFLGPKDRLRLADVYLLAFAFVVGTAILSFFTLYVLTYPRSESEANAQLSVLSNSILKNFSDETTKISKELDLLDARRRDAKSQPADIRNILPSIENEPYPYFQRVAWSDQNGIMAPPWTLTRNVDPTRLPQNIVLRRDWFAKVIEGNFRELDRERLWLGPLTSKYSGDKTVLVSKPVKTGSQREVIAFDPTLMSLTETVLPDGFGFRVIDASGTDPADDGVREPGKVLFQSAESNQLNENFFQECDNDRSLRSLIFGRASGFVDVDYKGQGHAMYVAPVAGFPNWSLVVFRNKQPLRTTYLEILTLAVYIFVTYAIILLVGFTIIYVVKVRMDERTEWIWPSDEMAPVYQQTLSANLILSLVALAIILTPMFSERPTTLVVLISLLGYAAVLVLALRLKIGWLLKKVQLTENWVLMNRLIARRGGAYVWNVVILLTLTAVFPAVTAFKVAYNTQMKLFLKHEQLTIAQALDRRNKHVIAQYSARQTSGEAFIKPVDSRQLNSRQVDSKQADPRQADSRQVDLSKFIARRLDDPLQLGHAFRPDVYTNFFYESRIGTWSEKGKQSPRGLIGFIDSLAPFFNESTVQTRSLLADSASDNSFEWGESADQLVFHQERKNETNPALQSDGLRIITPLKRFGPDVALRHFPNVASIAAWVMGFMIIIAIIFLVARFVVRKIFLLNVTRDLYPKTVGDLDGNQNLFLVNHLPTTSSNGFMHAPEHVVIDLGVEVSTNGWVDQIERRLREQSNINSIVIRHFEHGLNNQVINDQKLRLVESLLASHRPVVIMSALEPVAYFSPQGDGANNGDAPVNDNTGERWARAISRFKKLYTAPRRIGVRENALSELQAAFDSDKDISDEKRRLVLELAAQVYEECAAFPSLEDLSSDIIARLPFENRDWNQIKQEISDRAELYYRRIWENCSDGERLTLMHLAQDRLLSPNDPDIGPLLHKHLITFGPDLRPMNETFKEFLLAHTTNDNLRIKEIQAKNISQWEAFKIPLFVGFAAVLVFLVFTQKDLYNSSWTLVTVLTTGVPAIFKVISLFQTASSGGKLFNA